jgi:amino acid adenylation domain-containing protein
MTVLALNESSLLPPKVAESKYLRAGKHFRPFTAEELEQAISDRFEQQVRLGPDRLAVKTTTHELSYAALNRFANRLARAILAVTSSDPEPVLLLLDKDAPLIAAMLGVLKAGKFYVPMAPSNPEARNALIAVDSRARLILTDAKNVAAARRIAGDSLRVLLVEEVELPRDDSDLGLAISADDYAYIIYTSGSTGQPKGVVDTHRNLMQNIRRYTNSHYLSADDRLICVNSCAFSNSLKDVYGALLNGASFFPFDVEREGLVPLAEFMSREGITVLNAVATVFRHFANDVSARDGFPRIRFVRVGSEAVTKKDVELLRQHFAPSCVLVNGYGTTETGTVRVNFVDRDTEMTDSVVPIGYAVDGTDVLLIDEKGVEVGPGRVGQIAVRSAYMSPGYWHRPDLTAAVYRRDPDGGNRRIYLTGDLAMIRPDGCLVYAGRKDFQVKIRGNRIEVAEIELALLDSPKVKEVVVVQRSDLVEDRSLVAYVVAKEGLATPPTASELRDHLKGRLPDYFIPSAFVLLEALPQTSTGKLDRNALPPPTERRDQAVPFTPARTVLEAQLAEMWKGLLKVNRVGVRDNFFDLGGHSLLAAQLFAQISRVFGKTFPLTALLEAGTIEQLATLIEREDVALERPCLIPIQPRGAKPPFFCVHGVGGEVLSYERLVRHLDPDQPFYAFQAKGLYTEEEPHARIEDMAAHYLDELVRFQPAGPYYLGGYSLGGLIAYEMAQQLRQQGREVALVVIIDQRRIPLDGRGPRSVAAFAQLVANVPQWLREDLLRTPPREMLVRVKVKLGTLKRQLANWFRFSGKEPQANVADLFDLSRVPERHSRFLQILYRAGYAYNPQPYTGRVVLLRATAQPLFRLQSPQMGWEHLVQGGLEIQRIPGTHFSVMTEPNVRVLASKLRELLNRVRPSSHAPAIARPA